ncbi:xkdM-like portal protein (endogenous virus) [Clostridium phage phiCT453A]|uniref:tail protein n=1 Tax=Clostridium phage phiCT453A TaxID=1567012 RepID=UPI000514594B|nr:phage tail tube protein [Clostridium tetani]YP_009216686.1 tail protein [Clostridium phage phiCT453A]AJA42532.1 xkdM-like portal protein [Clostridium phage phiCT453A]KGI42511.1 phage portal protein [Clostridium tetani]RXI46265.1 phage portal protein [Clostridium tetani]RXM58106.1 phage portal protein [Clostridium tetani]RXM61811.1 phage portal protein [Clostridium tetani]
MGFFKAEDTISGQEARAYITVNGRNEELFYAKKIESKVEKQKTEVKTLGRRGTQNKAAGWKGTGTLTVYYATSLFRELMLKYMKDGIDTYFDLAVTNEDPTSNIGKQTIVLKNCNLDEVSMAMFDVDSEVLEEDMSFTFEDVDMLDKFNKPVLG